MRRVNAAVNGLVGLGVLIVVAVGAGLVFRAFMWGAGL